MTANAVPRPADPRPLIVFVVHAWAGGVARHVADLREIVAADCRVFVLRPAGSQAIELVADDGRSARFDVPGEWDALLETLRELGVARLHYHHVHGMPPDILALPRLLECAYDCTVHDYYPACPQYHLSDERGRYCGEPDTEGCARCLEARPAQWPVDIVEWRRRFADFLGGAERVIVPSRDVARRLHRYFPKLAPAIWPHPEGDPVIARPRARVLLVGALSPEKGLDRLFEFARDARDRDLPVCFIVLGAVGRPVPEVLPIAVRGEYDGGRIDQSIADERPDVIAFPAQVPETWSYTLSAAIRSGFPIVASDLGAFPERLAGLGATLLPADASAGQWNDAFVARALACRADIGEAGEFAAVAPPAVAPPAVAPPAVAPPVRPPPVGPPPFGPRPVDDLPARAGAMSWAQYGALYRAPVLAARQRSGSDRAFALRAAASRVDRDAGSKLSLSELYLAGVACGHAEARRELARRVREEDATRSALAHARQRILELETSTTWRISAPLRRSLDSLKLARRALRSEWRRLPAYAAVSREVLRTQGTHALARRITGKLRGRGRFRPRLAKPYRLAAQIEPLTLPTVGEGRVPAVSIVIPVYGKPLYTFTCLASLARHPGTLPFEVIVVDDAAPVPAATELAVVGGATFVRNEANLGFVGSCNRGASLARGETLVFLNNDTVVTERWLEALLAPFAADPRVGLVGAKLLYPDGTLQEAGGIVWRDGSAWNVGRGDDPDRPEYNYVRDVDYCSGACLAIPRALFARLGGFDSRYAPAYYEDTDLAFSVRAAGYRTVYQPAAGIVHFEGATAGTDDTAGVKRHQQVNCGVFAAKWATALEAHRPNGLAPVLERDRAATRRVLVVDACMLTPDQDSGSMRMAALLGILRSLGCKVTFVADNLEYRQPYVAELQQAGVEVLFAPYVTSIEALLDARGREFDVVVLSRHYVAARHVESVRRHAPDAQLVFDTVDLHFLREERLAQLQGNTVLRQSARARRAEELELIRHCDQTWVVSAVEQRLLRELVPECRIEVVSNVHDPMPEGAPCSRRAGIVFIGGFRHPPNADAVLWYAREVVPLLREALPGARTTIIGPDVPASLRELAADDLVFAGFVPDVGPYFRKARVSVSPLRYGAGVKGKVNLALSWGVPVVATSTSIEGMFLEPERDVLVADSAEAFVAAIVRLHRDDALWERLARAGREHTGRHFSREVARDALIRALGLAVPRGARREAAVDPLPSWPGAAPTAGHRVA